MVDFTEFKFPTLDGTAARTMPARLSDVVYAGEYFGNGRTATQALQAAAAAAFGPPDAPLEPSKYRPLIFPPGDFQITSPIRFRSLHGGLITGSGRFATRIINSVGGSVFVTNGCQYSKFENMRLSGNGSGVVFDLDWDKTGTALQSNTFQNIYFDDGAIGCRIGNGGYMGSENFFLNCFFANHSTSGLSVENFNALQNVVVGGNFQTCGKGIHVSRGSVTNIVGVGFQQSTTCDIHVENGANDAMTIQGCRSESESFAVIGYQAVSISGCCQTNDKSGIFLSARLPFSMDACTSIAGQVRTLNGGDIRSCQFGRDDWINIQGGSQVNISKVFIGKTLVGSGTGRSTVLERGYISASNKFINA